MMIYGKLKKYFWVIRFIRKKIKKNLLFSINKYFGIDNLDFEMDGTTIKLSYSHPYHYYFAKKIKNKEHEYNLLYMWKMQSEKAAGSILDCGGYSGVYGIVAAKFNPNATVYIFEPDPINFSHIERNIALNELKNVIPVNAAIFETSGNFSFKQHSGGEAGNIATDHSDFEIKCYSIDDWMNTNNIQTSLIKLDIEGAEYRALLGAKETLAKSKGLKILLEVHYDLLKKYDDDEAKIWRLFNEVGYDNIFLDKCIYNYHYWVYKTKCN